jgi:hypothetical protein
MLTFVTVFFPAVLLVAVLALERMERQFHDQASPDQAAVAGAAPRGEST